ncbi:hypothetical protein EVAR_66667_1 [Eumeta japonica]|uniref:Uncharacterized protein n=1 Tax=Eumeta variegata TaxID=151549 RepID=A0A4C1ZDX4_EUMVA|nr:hypothetical protein EVAR_66667_1 [Eumeta japonica]
MEQQWFLIDGSLVVLLTSCRPDPRPHAGGFIDCSYPPGGGGKIQNINRSGGGTERAPELAFFTNRTDDLCETSLLGAVNGLMTERKGRYWSSITLHHILAIFALAEIVFRCTLAMIDFQCLMTDLMDWYWNSITEHRILAVFELIQLS